MAIKQKHTILSLLITLCMLCNTPVIAQTDSAVYFKGAIKQNRATLYRNLVKNTITKNLSLTLTDSTEENWQDAFFAMEVTQFKSPWAMGRMQLAFDSIESRSTVFQRSLLEISYTLYQKEFTTPVAKLLSSTHNEKVFALAAEYLLLNDSSDKMKKYISNAVEVSGKFPATDEKGPAVILSLYQRLLQQKKTDLKKILTPLLAKDFLEKRVVVYSFQRKNRNYPGLVVVRDSSGKFITNETGELVCIPQLARSVTNLPYYLTNGNTPQGIFRMHGFDVSGSSSIGPTANIQLTMPFETSIQHFLNDSTITDSLWIEDCYKKLLPKTLISYLPLYQSYYAGKAGRTEIIAHGSTVDPSYYKGQPFYPLTPTQGCLATKEIWSEANGQRLISDQQLLVNTLAIAGGSNGYYVVIELDDQQKAVSPNELIPYLTTAAKN